MKEMSYQDINADTIDRWIRDGWEWGKPISHDAYAKAENGEWDVHLTPTKSVPYEWLGDLKGKRILGRGARRLLHGAGLFSASAGKRAPCRRTGRL